MRELPGGIRPEQHSSAEPDPSIAVKPLFAEGQQCHGSKRDGPSVGLLLHRPVDEVVKVEDIMSAIDAMLLDMALHGYVQPVAQSEVVRTLKEIHSSGKLNKIHRMASPPVSETCGSQKRGDGHSAVTASSTSVSTRRTPKKEL